MVRLRSILVATHVAMTPLLGAFVYSPTLRASEWFFLLVQLGAFPLAAIAGACMWLGPRWRRLTSKRDAAFMARGFGN